MYRSTLCLYANGCCKHFAEFAANWTVVGIAYKRIPIEHAGFLIYGFAVSRTSEFQKEGWGLTAVLSHVTRCFLFQENKGLE